MATPSYESPRAQSPLPGDPDTHYTTSTSAMVPEHSKVPSKSENDASVTQAETPRTTADEVGIDRGDDPAAHSDLDQTLEHIAEIERTGTAPRAVQELPLEDKAAQRTVSEAVISRMKEDVARVFNSTELYDTYVRKLEKLSETEDPAIASNDQEKPKVLVRGLIDFLRSYEGRMKKVEDKLGILPKPETREKAEDASDISGTKFYNANDHVGASMYAFDDKEDEWNVKGAFCSTVDANHRIRALFRWKSKPSDDTADVLLPPDPKSVDIIELRIKSKPVAAFFQKELDYDISKDGLIHIVKPFRCLITKADSLRQHVNRVEEKLRYVHWQREEIEYFPILMLSRSLAGSSEGQVDDEASRTTNPESLESRMALTHLRDLLSFIESYLEVDIALFQEYKNGSNLNVSFSNLWMLFDSNDTIFCPIRQNDGKIHAEEDETIIFWSEEFQIPQTYRVLATLGGNTRRASRAKKKSARTAEQDEESNVSQHIREQWTSLVVDCYFISFDGVRFRAVGDAFEFKPFPGEVPVTSLEAYPLLYHTNEINGGKETLQQRGAEYTDLTSVQHVSHKGLTLTDPKEEINSPVIVDFKSAFDQNPSWRPELRPVHIVFWPYIPNSIFEIPKRTCSHPDCHKVSCLLDASLLQKREAVTKRVRDINIVLDDYKVESKEQIEKFKEDMKSRDLLHLMPGEVFAFALRSRKWVILDLNNLGGMKQEDNWNDLVLPSGHKEMVQAMVENFTSTGSAAGGIGSRDDFDIDLVPGKGKGCIILLHGEPGVGKTSTAECVAAYTKRPLYPITCGDIGVTPADVENSLDKHFSQAHKWGCVLLLDEADVFLAKRNKVGDDITRNALVSIFLRTLEYYSGILFLTTNRVGSFDDAFRSRIHVQLYYPKLTEKQALKIWKTNVARLQRQNEDRRNKNMPEITIDRKKIVSFARSNFKSLNWNGRQIRNAFQTAVALAVFECRIEGVKTPEVTKKHFQKVASTTSDFDDYLKQVHTFDEETIARRDKDRVPYTPVTKRFKPVGMVDDSSSSDADSSSSSDEATTEDDSSSSESEEKNEKSDKKKRKKKEAEKKNNKSRKTRDSDKTTQKR